MTIETEIIKELLEIDHFHNEDSMVAGIAQRAKDNGYDSLSGKQKDVLKRFLEMRCPGIKDPGRNHNNCQNTFDGEELRKGAEMSYYYGEILCANCRQQADDYKSEWERFSAE